MSHPQLFVLGSTLLQAGSTQHPLERKTAAVLTYLALEGASSRRMLARLLWPDSPEETGRNNLSQLLRRLRALAGEVVTGKDTLELSGVWVDARHFRERLEAGTLPEPPAGSLLAQYDYDDLYDFADWLLVERERLTERYGAALKQEVARLEEAGNLAEALRLAEGLVDLDPVAEEPYRLLMKLHARAGDRSSALRVFERLRGTLERELDVEPLPETVALAKSIEAGRVAQGTRGSIPLTVLRPPVLVGREAEWAQLEAGASTGACLCVTGAAGIGKTRLLLDFAYSRGRYLFAEGRPGDEAAPLSSLARAYRAFLTEGAGTLEPWVAAELARFLPEYGEAAANDPETSLRFHEALYSVLRSVTTGVQALVFDDVQAFDAASLELLATLLDRLVREGRGQPLVLLGYRQSDLAPAFASHLEALQEANLALELLLPPLNGAQLETLLKTLQLPDLPLSAAELQRHTGGNPLFLIETLKHTLETGAIPHSDTGGRLSNLLHERLAGLSPEARALVEVAAVSGGDFSLDLAGTILVRDAFDLFLPYEELEAAGMLERGHLSHALLAEAALETLPPNRKRDLHAGCGQYLEANNGDPARTAGHLLSGERALQAAPQLFRAGERAQGAYRLTEAADFYERAADIYLAAGEGSPALEAYSAAASMLESFDTGERLERITQTMLKSAVTPLERVRAFVSRSNLLTKLGQGAAAEAIARAGLPIAEGLEGAYDRAYYSSDLLNNLGFALWLQGRLEGATEAMKASLALCETLDKPADTAITLSNLGVMLDHLERHAEAISYHAQAERILADLGNKTQRVNVLNNLSISHSELGQVRRAEGFLRSALELTTEVEGSEGHRLFTLMLLGAWARDVGDYGAALEHLHEAEGLAGVYASYGAPNVYRQLGQTLTLLGAYAEARAYLEASRTSPDLPAHQQAATLLLLARLEGAQGHSAEALVWLEAAQGLITPASRTLLNVTRKLTEATLLGSEARLEAALSALEHCEQYSLNGYLFEAHTRTAEALLDLGQPEAALEHTQAALGMLERFEPLDFYLPDLYLTHYRIQEALADGGRERTLERAQALVQGFAETCSAAYREGFLEGNPVNRGISSLISLTSR